MRSADHWLEFEMNSPNLREEMLMRPADHRLVERVTEFHHLSTPVLQARHCHHHHLLVLLLFQKVEFLLVLVLKVQELQPQYFDSIWPPRLLSSLLNTRPLEFFLSHHCRSRPSVLSESGGKHHILGDPRCECVPAELGTVVSISKVLGQLELAILEVFHEGPTLSLSPPHQVVLA